MAIPSTAAAGEPTPAAAAPPDLAHPRSRRARQRIMAAAIELLAEVGPFGFTMDLVAARARASKQTIYRLWRSRDALIREVIEAQLATDPEPDTGSLEEDLWQVVRDRIWAYTQSPFARVQPMMLAAGALDPQLFDLFQRRALYAIYATLERIIERGRDRGEVAADTDAMLMSELLLAPLARRAFLTYEPLDEEYGRRVLARVLRAFSTAPLCVEPGAHSSD